VHAEYSRNTNSDARKILQLRRSLGRAPLSKFSTGSAATLRDAPAEAGVDVAAALRALWGRAYLAPATTVAVLGPQELGALEAAVREAFSEMPAAPRGDGSNGDGDGSAWQACGDPAESNGSGGGGGGEAGGESSGEKGASDGAAGPPSRYGALAVYGEEQRGALVKVAPMRELRTLEVQWWGWGWRRGWHGQGCSERLERPALRPRFCFGGRSGMAAPSAERRSAASPPREPRLDAPSAPTLRRLQVCAVRSAVSAQQAVARGGARAGACLLAASRPVACSKLEPRSWLSRSAGHHPTAVV
jgi:hypothetical protein